MSPVFANECFVGSIFFHLLVAGGLALVELIRFLTVCFRRDLAAKRVAGLRQEVKRLQGKLKDVTVAANQFKQSLDKEKEETTCLRSQLEEQETAADSALGKVKGRLNAVATALARALDLYENEMRRIDLMPISDEDRSGLHQQAAARLAQTLAQLLGRKETVSA